MAQCLFCSTEWKSEKALRSHQRLCRSNPEHVVNPVRGKSKRAQCKFCNNEFAAETLNKHQQTCRSNPVVILTQTRTCLCGETFIPPLNNANKKYCSKFCASQGAKKDNYKRICFTHHKKECVVCGEANIVAVHHYNENHNDDRPENLIPLCPTHHHYMHSMHRDKISHIIDEYVRNFKKYKVGRRDQEFKYAPVV